MYIYVVPSFIPLTSSNYHFYESELYNKGLHFSLKPWNLSEENSYWEYQIKQGIQKVVGGLSDIQKATLVSNHIFREVTHDLQKNRINSHTAFKYVWNRLACFKDRLDLMIDKICLRDKSSFRPLMVESKLHNKIVRTLIINSWFIKDKNKILDTVQLLFNYISGENKDHCGRIIKNIIESLDKKIDLPLYEAAEIKQINLLSKKDECFIYSDFKKIFIHKKKKNKNLEKFEEIIKTLDQDKMKKAYNYLIAIIKDN